MAVFRFKLDELLLLWPPPVTVAVDADDVALLSLDECCIIDTGASISDSSEESRCCLSPPLQGDTDKSIGLIGVSSFGGRVVSVVVK